MRALLAAVCCRLRAAVRYSFERLIDFIQSFHWIDAPLDCGRHLSQPSSTSAIRRELPQNPAQRAASRNAAIESLRDRLHCIIKKRHPNPVLFQRWNVDVRPDDALSLTGIRNHLSHRIHNHAPTGVVQLRIASDPVNTSNVALIFNGARLKKFYPM
jgi:hypothetical protein